MEHASTAVRYEPSRLFASALNILFAAVVLLLLVALGIGTRGGALLWSVATAAAEGIAKPFVRLYRTLASDAVYIGGYADTLLTATMTIRVRDIYCDHDTCNSTALEVVSGETTTVGDVKAKYEKLKGIPVDAQQFSFKGKTLEDSRTLASYDIDDDATILLLFNTTSQQSEGN